MPHSKEKGAKGKREGKGKHNLQETRERDKTIIQTRLTPKKTPPFGEYKLCFYTTQKEVYIGIICMLSIEQNQESKNSDKTCLTLILQATTTTNRLGQLCMGREADTGRHLPAVPSSATAPPPPPPLLAALLYHSCLAFKIVRKISIYLYMSDRERERERASTLQGLSGRTGRQ